MQALVMSMNLLMHSLLLMILLIWLQVNLLEPGADKLLHFLIALMSSSLENEVQDLVSLSGISSKSWRLTLWNWVELKELWSVLYKSFNSIHGRLLNWITSTTGSLHFLTQFINSHGPHFLLVILVILSLKNTCLDFLTIFLKSFQFSRLWDCWYLLILLQQSLFHHTLECLVILTIFECLNQILSILIESSWMILRISIL